MGLAVTLGPGGGRGAGKVTGYLLDTNHIGHAVTPGSIVRRRIAEARAQGIRVGTCVPVLCEIEAGLQQVSQPETYRHNLQRLLREVRVWPIDQQTAQGYGAIHRDLKQRGRVLSQVDIPRAANERHAGDLGSGLRSPLRSSN